MALGAPHRKVAFTVPTGNFGDIFAGYVAERMGLPIDRLVIATNVNDILVRTLATGGYELRERDGDLVALDGHPGLVELRAAAVRGLRPRRGGGARADGVAGAVAALLDVERGAVARSARSSAPAAPTSRRSPPCIRTALRETGRCIDPHTAVGIAVAEKEAARSRRSR